MVIRVRDHGESYYIQDILTDRVYLRNRRYIKRSNTAKNEQFKAENMEVLFNKNLQLKVDNEGKVSEENIQDAESIMKTPRKRSPSPNPNYVEFDGTTFSCKNEMDKWRKENGVKKMKKKKKEENLTPPAL